MGSEKFTILDREKEKKQKKNMKISQNRNPLNRKEDKASFKFCKISLKKNFCIYF